MPPESAETDAAGDDGFADNKAEETVVETAEPVADLEANTAGAPDEIAEDEDVEPMEIDTEKATAPAKTGTAVRKDYPPSFFTDDRGNLKAVNFIVRNPCKVFWMIIVLCFVISFLLQVLVFRKAEGSPFTTPQNEYDVSDVRSIQYDSLRLAKDDVSATRAAMGKGAQTVLKQSELSDIAYWVFEGEDDVGLFGSAANIQGMKDAYDVFYEDKAFIDWCVLDYREEVAANETRGCVPPLTPLTMYYASEWDSEMVAIVIEELKKTEKLQLFNDLSVCVVSGLYCGSQAIEDASVEDRMWVMELGNNITAITSKWDMKGPLVTNFTQVTELASLLIQVDLFKGTVDFGFDTGFSADNPVSQYSRGIVFWGGPLDERNTTGQEDDEEAEELKESDDKLRKEFIKSEYLVDMEKQSEEGTHSGVNTYYFMTAIIGDVILGIVTQDALLALFSLAFVFFWLRINTRSWFLAYVGLLEIFFSIPIAWFIFTVVFQIEYFATLNSLALFVVAAIGADDIFIFMDAYKQSQYHVEILDDLETRMSWVYRRTGTAMAITSATTCAAFLCTLITPLSGLQSFGIFAAVVIFIDYVLVMTLFCTSVIIYHNRYEDRAACGCCCPCGTIQPSNTEKAKLVLEQSDEEIKRDRVSEFFRTKVSKFIQTPLYRLVVGVVFLIWLGIAIWQASLLESTKESEQFLDENHPLQKSITILNKQFPTADDDLGLKVYYAWGLNEVDRKGVNRLLDPEFFGEPRYDSWFEFTPECQGEIIDFCDTMRADSKYKDLIKRKDGLGSVFCWVEELAAFNANPGAYSKRDRNQGDCNYVKQGTWKNGTDWQVDPANLSTIMPEFMAQKTCFGDDLTETISGRYSNEIGWDGTQIKYVAVSVESKELDPFGLDAESLTRREYDQFIEIRDKYLDSTRKCLGNVITTDLDEKFVFMNNQAIYVKTAIQSSILGVVIAFVVLMISTRVFHLAFFASLSITAVLVSVVGTMVMLGWSLGSIESTLIGIIAGFSVDYVVHLAHAYEIASGDTYSRVTEAFSDLGISVFNGMITSVVASIPLFFCQLQFFAKFGTFLCLTIAYSWIFANFGFMSVLAQLKIPLKEGKCFQP